MLAGGSVLVTAVAHASFNAFGDRPSNGEHLVGDPFLASVGGLVGLAVMALAVLVVYRLRLEPRHTPSGAAGDLRPAPAR